MNLRTPRAQALGPLFSLALVTLAPSLAEAQRARRPAAAPVLVPSTIRLDVRPVEGSYRWSFALTNTGNEPQRVIVDRRFLWLEVLPAESLTPAPRGRARATNARSMRCAPSGVPTDSETSPAELIDPEGVVREGFDLRALCGLRMPATLTAGARVVFHCGPRARPAAHRALVLDGSNPPVTELVSAPVVLPGTFPTAAPAPATVARSHNETTDAPMRLRVSGSFDADDLRGIRLTYTLRNESAYPLRVFHRPGMVRLAVRDPLGRDFECYAGPREYPFMREFVVRLTSGRSVRGTVELNALCDRDRLSVPGVYRAIGVFAATQADPSAYGERGFTGSVASDPFYFRLRVARRDARYVPLPEDDVFAPPRRPANAQRSAREENRDRGGRESDAPRTDDRLPEGRANNAPGDEPARTP